MKFKTYSSIFFFFLKLLKTINHFSYRKVPGDMCIGGNDFLYEPDLKLCPVGGICFSIFIDVQL